MSTSSREFPTWEEAEAEGRAVVAEMIERYKAAGQPVPRIDYHPSLGFLIRLPPEDEDVPEAAPNPATSPPRDPEIWPDPGSRDFLNG